MTDGKQPSDTKITAIKTSAGPLSEPGGSTVGFAMPETDGPVYGTEDAPTGLPVSRNLADPFVTSANQRGQLSTPEGGSGSQNNI